MTEAERDEELSVFAVGTVLVRHGTGILRWAFSGAIIALALVWTRPALYRASASFIPQSADAGRSGLASLAGQFGVSVPSGSPTLTPDFYLRLIKSRGVLERIVRDTLVVPEMGGKRVAVESLLNIKAGSPKSRMEDGVDELSHRISASASKSTSIVEFNVGMEWPSVSLAIANELLDGVNEFNQRTRRDQASAERKFIEGRLEVATKELRAAEDRLQQFLQGNRQVRSPDLQLTQDRMQRDVTLRQQVFSSLTQSYDEVRTREVRDTPVITMVDDPMVPAKPDPRGRGTITLLGFLIGAAVGVALSFMREHVAKQRKAGDSDADEFVSTVAQIKRDVLGRLRRISGRASA